MSDEAVNVSFEDLTQEQEDIIEKSTEEFRVKCLESFGRTRNKVIQKVLLPKVLALGEVDKDKDTEQDKQIFQQAVHEAVSHALINQSGVFMNTIRNVIRDAMNGSLMQE